MFIVFEGIEGSGKSTLLSYVSRGLQSGGYDVVETREPGGTMLGDAVREIFLRGTAEIVPLTEALLLNAARAQHVKAVVRPALDAGRIVLCDRFTDSTLAYQGYGRGLDIGMLRTICSIAASGLEPDLTFVLNVPLRIALDRLNARSDQLAFFVAANSVRPARVHLKERTESADRIERETDDFHEKVRQGYLALARESVSHVVLDGTRAPDDIAYQAMSEMHSRLGLNVP